MHDDPRTMKNRSTRFALAPAVLGALVLAACGSTNAGGQGVEPYPLETCVVMDSELGSMGDPVSIVYEGRELKFCCEPCVDAFYEDPDTFLAKVDELAAQKD